MLLNSKRKVCVEVSYIWLDHTDVNDSEGLAMIKSRADELGIKTFSNLWEYSSELVITENEEFFENAGQYIRLKDEYGSVEWKDEVIMDHNLTFKATKSGEINIVSVYTTEGLLESGDFIILEDDKYAWPPYYLTLIIRNNALEAHPEVTEIVNKVTAAFTTENVIAMNTQIDVDGEDYTDIAKEYYADSCP